MAKFTLPQLNYKFSELEPYIDVATVELHYGKHHQAYTDKLNLALEAYPDLQSKSIEELLCNLEAVPTEIRNAVRNNGGGYYNHNLYWKTLTPNGRTDSAFQGTIAKVWGTWEKFVEEFSQKALTQFGSGWVWLVQGADSKLSIVQTSNQDVPAGKHLLALDVWEHAYYLKYQNRRADYVQNWWKVVDWEAVGKLARQ